VDRDVCSLWSRFELNKVFYIIATSIDHPKVESQLAIIRVELTIIQLAALRCLKIRST
jgi:hypothetical protein